MNPGPRPVAGIHKHQLPPRTAARRVKEEGGGLQSRRAGQALAGLTLEICQVF